MGHLHPLTIILMLLILAAFIFCIYLSIRLFKRDKTVWIIAVWAGFIGFLILLYLLIVGILLAEATSIFL